MSKIVVISSDTPLRELALPLAKARLEIVANNGGLCADEEDKVCAWCLGISVSGMECEVPEETIKAVATTSERTTSAQDRLLADWMLKVWAVVESLRAKA